ncbi:MAG: hypothetical protein JKX98_02275, partial [Alcanivoracaceae bacterium]|nr:hypothetical protein [Alcanivoracaceae bacterium]
DTPDPTDSLLQESLSQDLERTLAYLKGMEAEVIRLFYGLGGASEIASTSAFEFGIKLILIPCSFK